MSAWNCQRTEVYNVQLWIKVRREGREKHSTGKRNFEKRDEKRGKKEMGMKE